MFKRALIAVTLLVGVLLPGLALVFPPAPAAAVNIFPSAVCDDQNSKNQTVVCQQDGAQKKDGGNPIIKALQITITIMALIVGVSAVIVIMISGIRMITANGDSQSFARARSSVIYALIALVIAGLAETIVAFVLSRL